MYQRLPKHYAALVYCVIQAAMITAVATAIATAQLTGLYMWFFEKWVLARGLAWLTMLSVVLLAAPAIHQAVQTLTIQDSETNGG
jgi:hypothetical protein